jgi:hypothetical protein
MPRTTPPKHAEAHASPKGIQRRPQPIFRFSIGCFLGVLILNILISPFMERLRSGPLIETLLMTLVLLFAVLSIAGGRRALVGVVLVAPAALGEWLIFWRPETLIYAVTRGAGLLFIGFVVIQLLRFIVYAPRVDSEVLCAAVAAYLLSGLAWSLAYALLDRLEPNSFAFTLGPKSGESMNGFTGLYFSFITLSTVVTVQDSNGSVKIMNTRGAQVTTSFAGVILDGIAGALTVEDQNGAVDASISARGGCQPVSIKTSFSPLRLHIDGDASYRVAARTSFGRIRTDFPLTVAGSLSEDAVNGTIGAGRCELRLNDSNGNIEILKGGS